MQNSKLNRDLEFLFEIGQLRLMNRAWQRFFHTSVSNVSEHIFRVLWLSLIIARREKAKNEEKIIKIALIHDVIEGRTGDTDYLTRQYTDPKEMLAIKDILKETSLEKDFLKLYAEYKAKKTLEAQIVKDADNLDIDLELREQHDQKISQSFTNFRTKIIPKKLYTKSAKMIWKALQKTNPNDWHLNSRNRFNTGDWKSDAK